MVKLAIKSPEHPKRKHIFQKDEAEFIREPCQCARRIRTARETDDLPFL